MSDTKHTPEFIEWEVQEFPDSRHCRINPTGEMAECGAIADVYHSLANARLVAAAPQLLKCLKETRDVAAACFRLINESTDEHLMTDLEIELRRIEIADGFGKRADEAVRLAEKGK